MGNGYRWKWFWAGRMHQASLRSGEDVAHLGELDRKKWLAISMPVGGVRFDRRTLELMDSDGDGRIRVDEVVGAVEFLKSRGVSLDGLFAKDEGAEKALAEIAARRADLSAAKPSEEDEKALREWESRGTSPEVAVLGGDTAAANDALAAVEGVVDAFFTPPDDMPLVTEEPDKELPLKDHLNPKHVEAVMAMAEKCVVPLLGARDSLDRLSWKRLKAAFAPYRAWAASKPVASAPAKAELDDEERVLRYRMHLAEFLENFVNMKRLYDEGSMAMFQTGVLRIDAKEMNLCFHVESEAAHAALSARSNCCVVYLRLSRPSDKAERQICAVVTAGTVAGLYVGRNGVFYDRDGKDWEAVVTRVVESQVSLAEAFWAPWRKIGSGIADAAKKFLGDRQAAATGSVAPVAKDPSAGGAAMASSVAAIGIGIGMVGAALASVMAAVSGMTAIQIAVSVAAVILAVSLPSVILTWFKLRNRDIGAVLNASGWAINRPMRFSMKRARAFTVCARPRLWPLFVAAGAVLAACAAVFAAFALRCRCCFG